MNLNILFCINSWIFNFLFLFNFNFLFLFISSLFNFCANKIDIVSL